MRLLARSTMASMSAWVGAGAGWNMNPSVAPFGDFGTTPAPATRALRARPCDLGAYTPSRKIS